MSAANNEAPFFETIVAHFGKDATRGSAIAHESYFRALFGALKPDRVLEIGTRFGLSSTLFSQLAKTVTTIDIDRCPPEYKEMARKVWAYAKVEDRVHSFYATGKKISDANASKAAFIKGRDFDFCFVDGHHSLKAISFDYDCVRRCGCVLFHDYKPDTPAYADCDNNRMPDVVAFVDSLWPQPYLIGPKCSQMALWVSEDHPARKDPAAVSYLESLPRTATPHFQAKVRLTKKILGEQVADAKQRVVGQVKKWRNSIAKRLRPPA